MALPKKRHSKSRRDKRRTHWKLDAPSVVACPQCSQPKLPHRVCPAVAITTEGKSSFRGKHSLILPNDEDWQVQE